MSGVRLDPFNTAQIFGTRTPIPPEVANTLPATVSPGGEAPQALPRVPNARSIKGSNPTKGLRKALGDAFVADVFADWQIWGPVVIEQMRLQYPAQYAKMVQAILPKEVAFSGESPLSELTDEQLSAVYATFEEVTESDGPDASGGGGPESANSDGNEAAGGAEVAD